MIAVKIAAQDAVEIEPAGTIIQGNPGKDGVDGKTPVKGVDYWTEEDQADVIARVQKEVSGLVTDAVEAAETATKAAETATKAAEQVGELTGFRLTMLEDGGVQLGYTDPETGEAYTPVTLCRETTGQALVATTAELAALVRELAESEDQNAGT